MKEKTRETLTILGMLVLGFAMALTLSRLLVNYLGRWDYWICGFVCEIALLVRLTVDRPRFTRLHARKHTMFPMTFVDPIPGTPFTTDDVAEIPPPGYHLPEFKWKAPGELNAVDIEELFECKIPDVSTNDEIVDASGFWNEIEGAV